jgi:hypothetical protein
MPMAAEAAFAVGDSVAMLLAVKATVITALALIAARLARNSRASVRHLLLTAAFMVLLALPFGAWVAPSLHLDLPVLERSGDAGPLTAVVDAADCRRRPVSAANGCRLLGTSSYSAVRRAVASGRGNPAESGGPNGNQDAHSSVAPRWCLRPADMRCRASGGRLSRGRTLVGRGGPGARADS